MTQRRVHLKDLILRACTEALRLWLSAVPVHRSGSFYSVVTTDGKMDNAAVFQSAGDVSVLSAQADLRYAPVRLRTQSIYLLCFSIENMWSF